MRYFFYNQGHKSPCFFKTTHESSAVPTTDNKKALQRQDLLTVISQTVLHVTAPLLISG
jgi:hypothetical protein